MLGILMCGLSVEQQEVGEQADYIINSMIDGCWDFSGYHNGRRTRAPAQRVTCDHCGEDDLRWGDVKGGAWRLHTTDGELHVCPPAIEQIRGVSDVTV